MKIHWTPPAPRSGWRGHWDTFLGPGVTSAEEWLELLGGLALAAGALICYLLRNPTPPSAPQLIVLSLLALDLSGGIITTATSSAKRWYHREGQGLRQHLAFVLPHGLHLVLLVWLFPGHAWWFFPLFYAYLIVATLSILRVPLYLQRPLAMASYAGALVLNTLFPSAPGLEWFMPFLFLKLLIGHLLKEAPFRPLEEQL